jgi:demethylmenaquinone methyltransferase/2-methoxy-6-polyprenyl-1,4-benzoquinol methylase
VRERRGCRSPTASSTLTFTYLFRYVDDPAATIRELARVVRPGGTIAGLEFALPHGLARPAWELWVRAGLPVAGAAIGHGWHEVGTFHRPLDSRASASAGPSAAARRVARGRDRGRPRAKRLSLGGGIVTWGRKT